MKTRSLIAILFMLLAITYCSKAATVIVKISQFPNTDTPLTSDLFLLASGATNKNISWEQLRRSIGTNGNDVYYITTNYVDMSVITNLYVTNAYFQDFHGKTTFIENNYTTNLYAISSTIVTNYNTYSYVTNLYASFPSTNYYLFSTNLYITNLVNDYYVSNYFQTNVFADTYISNFFTTNQYNYLTNLYHYSTNLTVTNFYAGDTYVSNFFNTNIFVNDTYVSNFFTTNLYNTINITTNITYQMGAPLTNAVLYGYTTIDGYEATQNPYLNLIGYDTSGIMLDTKDASVTAAILNTVDVNANVVFFYEIPWDGPTNVLDCWGNSQYFTASSDCEITGIDSKPENNYGFGGVLAITNSAATNITLRFPATIGIPERTTSVTVSNASRGIFSIRWSPITGTNGVYRQF